MRTTSRRETPECLEDAVERLEVALPAPGYGLEQDEEWVVVHTDGEWRKIRLHDYADVFAVQGLYEKWVYDILRCASPAKIRALLERAAAKAGLDTKDLVVLDLGAGNGCVAEELRGAGVRRFVGVDIHEEAREAAERDRPGLYADYLVGDLAAPTEAQRRVLGGHRFSALTCVAALGFGDIPPPVFAAAYNLIGDGGLIAFTIKTDFLDESDKSGFSVLIRRLLAEGAMGLVARERYTHRVDPEGRPLEYAAFVGIKRAGIRPEWVVDA